MSEIIRSSAQYPDNKVSSAPYWEKLDEWYPGFYKDGLKNYLEHKCGLSHSIHAIVTGDLFAAIKRCDRRNWNHIKDWYFLMHAKLPPELWGSEEKTVAWLNDPNYDIWVDYYVPRAKVYAEEAIHNTGGKNE